MQTSRNLLHNCVLATVFIMALTTIDVMAQASGDTLHLGILSSGSPTTNRATLEAALVEGLREQGYVEGRNLTIERRYGTPKDAAANAQDLAGMKLDGVVTTCSGTTEVMKDASSSVPIVMAAVSDPVAQGIISSLARPGKNVTGTSSQSEDLLAKRLEILATVLPKNTVIAVLSNSTNPVHTRHRKAIDDAARHMNVPVIHVQIGEPAQLQAALESGARARAGGLLVLPDDPMMFNLQAQIVAIAAAYRWPDNYWAREYVQLGGLMSYGENLDRSYVAVAKYVDRIKKGANPATLPVEQPTRFELVLNAKRAKELGIVIPQSLLLRADEVLQ
jgi:ABC-type uncharacterized transport system substrate-binding protein